MNPVIRIDDDAFAILQSVAKPLVHSASDAIRELAKRAGIENVDKPEETPAINVAADGVTPHQAFRAPILATLRDLDGKAKTAQIKPVLYQKMRNQLTDADKRVLTSSNQERWWNAAQWERYFMRQEGLMKESPRGWWELSDSARS
jgi:Mrr restriction endonuclease-like protein